MHGVYSVALGVIVAVARGDVRVLIWNRPHHLAVVIKSIVIVAALGAAADDFVYLALKCLTLSVLPLKLLLIFGAALVERGHESRYLTVVRVICVLL